MDRTLARLRNIVTALAVVMLGTVVVATPSLADGNNGTVKIDGWTLDHGTGNGADNRNEPHVDCHFDVEWYNFEANATSTVTFSMQSPTSDVGLSGTAPGQVTLDNDDASGADAAGLDKTQPYTLAFAGDPHPGHGYHVKLTINTTWSNGAEVKHKVFWVEGCRDAAASVTTRAATCVSGEELIYGPATHATYSGTADHTQGPGSYEVIATAQAGHFFADGDSTETYAGSLAGPRTDCGEDTIPISPDVTMVDECGTKDDSGPDWIGENEYWTSAISGNSVVFTAKEGWIFPAGNKVTDGGRTWTEPFTPNTDVACPDDRHISFCHNENNLHEIKNISLSGFYHGHYLNALQGDTAHAGDLWPAFTWDDVDYPSNYAGDFDDLLEAGCAPPPCPNGDMNGEAPGCDPPPCPNGDMNGEAPGCDPPPCPNGDMNGEAPGCDPPPSCPAGQMDWNGPDVSGCGNPPSQPAPLELEETVEGCDLTPYGIDEAGEAMRTGLREYVWVLNEPPVGNGSWTLEPEADITWGAWRLTEQWTGVEYRDRCADDQPPALIREVAGVQASCRLQGTRTWVDVYTTEFVWNEETLAWEPGTETGPVRTDETFIEYTDRQFQNTCAEEPEVAGEQETVDHEIPDVAGEQAPVPGAVNAGLGSTTVSLSQERNHLWLLLLGSGLGLMGVAGRRRRPTADR